MDEGMTSVEGRIETGNLGDTWKGSPRGCDTVDIMRLVQGR